MSNKQNVIILFILCDKETEDPKKIKVYERQGKKQGRWEFLCGPLKLKPLLHLNKLITFCFTVFVLYSFENM